MTSVPVIIDAAERMVKRAGSRKPEEIGRVYRIELLDMDLKKRLKAYYLKDDTGAYEPQDRF